MRHWLLIGRISLFFCLSCGNDIPDDVIGRGQMPAVLVDMHLADGQLMSMPVDSARAYREAYYQAVFDRYGVDSSLFKRSVEFYSSRPAIMNELYVGVEKRLEALNMAEEQVTAEKYKAQQRVDSIKNARRLDSLNRIVLDSIALQRSRQRSFLPNPASLDSTDSSSLYERLSDQLKETIGLRSALVSQRQLPPIKQAPQKPPQPLPKNQQQPLLRPLERIK